jgi:hypothetical protein
MALIFDGFSTLDDARAFVDAVGRDRATAFEDQDAMQAPLLEVGAAAFFASHGHRESDFHPFELRGAVALVSRGDGDEDELDEVARRFGGRFVGT